MIMVLVLGIQLLALQVFRVKAEPRDFGFPFPSSLNSAGDALKSDRAGAAVKLEANGSTRLVQIFIIIFIRLLC